MTRYVMYTTVRRVSEYHPLGWFAFFEGSHESIRLGNERPDMNEGDHVKITIERVPKEDAKP